MKGSFFLPAFTSAICFSGKHRTWVTKSQQLTAKCFEGAADGGKAMAKCDGEQVPCLELVLKDRGAGVGPDVLVSQRS